MPRSSVIVRSLAVVGLGLFAVPAFGQSPNVTAFNPYSGVGASGGSAPTSVYAAPAGAANGMAFNPWNSGGVSASAAYSGRGDVQAPYATGSYSYGANLPAPPPGPIESRLTAVPQRGDRGSAPTARTAAIAPAPQPNAPLPIPVGTPAAPPPAAAPAAPPPLPVVVAPAPAPPPAAAPAPAPAPRAVASVAPPPPERVTPPPAPAAVMASVVFIPQSAEISAASRVELDRVAQNIKGVRGIELRAYASGSDPTEARKVALARALAVRSYLIDQNVKTRIEVGAFASTNGGSERVDVLAP